MEIEYRKNHKVNPKLHRWSCGGCQGLLGLRYNNGVLAIKYKDFTGYLISGEIKIICRFCKSENIYKSSNIVNLNE